MNVFNQDPLLPLGVLNLTAKNEPAVIRQCPVCGTNIYEGEWIYRIDGEVVCSNRRCLVDKVPFEKYASDFCFLGEFTYLISLSKRAGIKDILADDSGQYMPKFFTDELLFEFVEWLSTKEKLKRERITNG